MACVLGMHFQRCANMIHNDKMSIYGLTCTFIKATQGAIHKCITWFKKFGKGMQAWDKTCIDFRSRPKRLYTPMETKYTHFCYYLFGSRIYMYMHFMWFIDVLINFLLLLIAYISNSSILIPR
jgi:hypothetical protein